MAIKGKSKGRAARTVARGPKPVYTPVKRPFLQRKVFWYGVAAVLGVAAVVGLIYGFMKQRNEDRERDEVARMATAAREYGGQLDSILAVVGQANGAGFTAYPQLASALDGLEQASADTDTADIATSLGDLADSAKNAAEQVAAIDTTGIVQGKDLDPGFIAYLVHSKTDLTSGLRLYEQAASLGALAAAAAPSERGDLVARARSIDGLAGEVFGSGYDSYVQAQAMAGTFQPPLPSGLTGGLPPLTGATGGLTGATGATAISTGATGGTGSSGAAGATATGPTG